MVERQEPLTASLVDHLFLYHKCTKTMPFRPKGGEKLLSYDTTFSMGDFYVKVLLFKHCCFVQKPIIPALFLIHERKLQEHHQIVFRLL